MMEKKQTTKTKKFAIKAAGRGKKMKTGLKESSSVIVDRDGSTTIVDNFKEAQQSPSDALASPKIYSDAKEYIKNVRDSLELKTPIADKILRIQKTGKDKKNDK